MDDDEDDEVLLGAVRVASEQVMLGSPIVHIVVNGQALCRWPGVPQECPPGHTWVSLIDTKCPCCSGSASCPVCHVLLVYLATDPAS